MHTHKGNQEKTTQTTFVPRPLEAQKILGTQNSTLPNVIGKNAVVAQPGSATDC